MTDRQKAQILERIGTIQDDLKELRRVRTEIGTSGYSSGSFSSSGGQKSYQRMSIEQITSLIADLTKELAGLRKAICGSTNPIKTILTIYT